MNTPRSIHKNCLMKSFLSILIFLPLFSNSQNLSIGANQDRLIQSITSDTINGKYKEILFSYDLLKRVTSITERTSMAEDSSKKFTDQLITDTSIIQQFEYKAEQKEPFLRRTTSFYFDEKEKKWFWQAYELQYFIYENGKRVRDSILYKSRAFSLLDKRHEWDFDTTFKTYITNIKHTDSAFYYMCDKTSYANPMNLYTRSIVQHENSISQLSAHYFASFQIISNSFYKKFDEAINPFNQLNIATVLANEKLSFSFDLDKVRVNYEPTARVHTLELNWLFLNKTNALNYYNEGIDLYSNYKHNMEVSYIYNQLKLPVFCSINISLLDNDREVYTRKKRNFSFRYVD